MNELASGKHRLHIDDILGPASGRYFGAGFRRVKYRMHDVDVDAGRGHAGMRVDIQYPSEWSQKRNRELRPHLSTLDAMTIGAELVDVYLRHAYGLSEPEVARSWIRRAVMKASSTPTTDLSCVPASLTLQRTDLGADRDRGSTSHFSCDAGSITLEISVDHPAARPAHGVARFADIHEALGAPEGRHYAGRYKATRIDLDHVVLDAVRATATMSLDVAGDTPPAAGLSAEYEPFVSIMYGLIAAAQMSQILLYQQDQITRETSNNMWLRRLAVQMQDARVIDRPLSIQTQITRTSVVPMKGAHWRSANFITSFPGVQFEYNLAHELTSTTSAAPEKIGNL